MLDPDHTVPRLVRLDDWDSLQHVEEAIPVDDLGDGDAHEEVLGGVHGDALPGVEPVFFACVGGAVFCVVAAAVLASLFDLRTG